MRNGVESGYDNVPRDITLGAFVTTLDTSYRAFSERSRRGHGDLIEPTLLAGSPKEL